MRLLLEAKRAGDNANLKGVYRHTFGRMPVNNSWLHIIDSIRNIYFRGFGIYR